MIKILVKYQDFNHEQRGYYEPPYINARLNEVFPVSVRNTPRKIEELDLAEDFPGYEASYVDGKVTMRVIKCPGEDDANKYFGTTIVEEFKKKKIHTYDNLNGRWKATAKDPDGRQWLAWVNGIWVFVLNGSDEDHFDLVVRACKVCIKRGIDLKHLTQVDITAFLKKRIRCKGE